jgi:two-component system chemotaxis response regulator CheB
LVVIGTSLGGIAVLSKLVADFSAHFAAPILVVLHTGKHPSQLPSLLRSKGVLPAEHAVDGELPVGGLNYIAPPGRHLIAEDGRLRVTCGPKEHHARPAIDPLFMSAALSFGKAVGGMILTGTIEDGTAGLQAVKAFGGLALVQGPVDALGMVCRTRFAITAERIG